LLDELALASISLAESRHTEAGGWAGRSLSLQRSNGL